MVVQLTYEDTPAIAFNGMLAQQFALRQVDSGLAEGDILLGQAVSPGTADGQYIPTVADAAVSGIVIYSGSTENQSGDFTYLDKAQIPVLSKGRYYATAAGTTVIDDVLAFVIASGDVGPVSAGNTTLAFGKAITSGGADDLIIVEVAF